MNFKFPALPGPLGGLQFLVTKQPPDRTKLHNFDFQAQFLFPGAIPKIVYYS